MLETGCKKDSENTEVTEPEPTTPTPTDTCGTPLISYLANGHVLTYNYSIFGSTSIQTRNIKSIGNGEYKTILSSSAFVDSLYERECGGWLYEAKSQSLTNINKARKSSTSLNDSWTYKYGSTEVYYKVIEKNVSVTVPAGTFLCDKITYHLNGAATTDTFYFNNSVGDVKYVGAVSYELKAKNY